MHTEPCFDPGRVGRLQREGFAMQGLTGGPRVAGATSTGLESECGIHLGREQCKRLPTDRLVCCVHLTGSIAFWSLTRDSPARAIHAIITSRSLHGQAYPHLGAAAMRISGNFGLANLAKKGDTDLAMPSRASKNRPRDPNLLARSAVVDLIGQQWDGSPLPPLSPEPEKNPAAVALSKLGASKGGRARAAALSPRRRKMIAKKAAEARWRQ